MHTVVEGSPGYGERSTEQWQERQSIPSSLTWCRWSNSMGCMTSRSCLVAHGERTTIIRLAIPIAGRISKITPERRETVFVQRGKRGIERGPWVAESAGAFYGTH